LTKQRSPLASRRARGDERRPRRNERAPVRPGHRRVEQDRRCHLPRHPSSAPTATIAASGRSTAGGRVARLASLSSARHALTNPIMRTKNSVRVSDFVEWSSGGATYGVRFDTTPIETALTGSPARPLSPTSRAREQPERQSRRQQTDPHPPPARRCGCCRHGGMVLFIPWRVGAEREY